MDTQHKGDGMDKQAYYKALGHIQNHPKNAYQDIMTITGFMDDKAKVDHLLRYAELVGDQDIIREWSKAV